MANDHAYRRRLPVRAPLDGAEMQVCKMPAREKLPPVQAHQKTCRCTAERNCAACEGGEGALNEKEEIHANRKELEVHFVVFVGLARRHATRPSHPDELGSFAQCLGSAGACGLAPALADCPPQDRV
jgi:hypothetical protein